MALTRNPFRRGASAGQMAKDLIIPDAAARKLRWPLGLTRAGMVAERLTRAFWPFASVLLLVMAALMFGAQDNLSLEIGWSVSVLAILAGLVALVIGLRRFRWPGRAEALDRLDRTLPGRPITAILDHQAIGARDAESRAVWNAHVARMAERAARARAVEPDLRISSRDPYALRYVALLAFIMALVFGSIWRVASVTELATGGSGAYASGPAWEGWVEPPAYTGKPSIYLADISQESLSVPEGSRITLRLYGEIGALTVAETVSGRTGEVTSAADPSQEFEVTQSGSLSIDGPGGRDWRIEVVPDMPPAISSDGEVERGVEGEMRLPFSAEDDYGVVAGTARIELDLASVDRRYGLQPDPEPREPIVLDLPMPITGDRTEFTETLIENLAQHPWATLPVTVTLLAEDAAGQPGSSEPVAIELPGRRFFDPLANALVEQRRDLLWNSGNGARVSQVLRAASYRPEEIFDSSTAYLMLRVAIRRLEMGVEFDQLSNERRDEIAQALWDIAVLIEDGNLTDALERLRRAQDRLSEAMEQGASDEEIAELMQELREAMQDYMRQLAEQGQQDGNQQAQNENMQEITGDQLQEMLDRLQELMEQGRMAEAEQLLEQLRQMMENMQVTQGQPGEGQQSPGQQAMEGLADTLRQQQGLNDDTFGDLQEQFGDQGQQQGQQGEQGQGQQGQQGQPGQGQQGQQGQGQQGEGQQGQQGQPGQGTGQNQGDQPGMGLADRQQALRDQLNQQTQNLPGAGTPGGDAARDALDRAGRAMDGAEEALRDEDFAGALDNQAEAMEALREGMRELGRELAQQQQQQSGQQGEAFGQNESQNRRDPLGRDTGADGRIGTDEQLLQGEDVYRRARELLDEIRRRSSDQTRPDVELDYLKRLLDRF